MNLPATPPDRPGDVSPDCPAPAFLSPEAVEAVAARFRALSEPVRLRLLDLLRGGERTAGDLAAASGTTPANVSRHLSVLKLHGLVACERRGTTRVYRLDDENVGGLCDRVCDTVARRHEQRSREERALREELAPRR